MSEPPAIPDALAGLTPARVALGRSGTSLPTGALLAFRADHALARDAVHEPFDAAAMIAQLGEDAVLVHTGVSDRSTYLRRPDLGRHLSGESADRLAGLPVRDVVVIISDGLSATGVERHGAALVRDLVDQLQQRGLTVTVLVAPFARVGLLSDAGSVLSARAAAIVIGERPGLSAPDNLSIYVEVDPTAGHTDADRNCLSNIRPGGLDPTRAATQAAHLIVAGLELGHSGTALSVEFDETSPVGPGRAPLDPADSVSSSPLSQEPEAGPVGPRNGA